MGNCGASKFIFFELNGEKNQMTQQQIIPGSLGAVARKNNTSLAASFLDAAALVMVDVSGSMSAHDAGNGKTRFDAAVEQLGRLQRENPGEIGVCCFSSSAEFCPGGVPVFSGGTTDMAGALGMLKMAVNCGVKLILISDGEPDDQEKALAAAAKFSSRIDTIFVGEETSSGREFLRRLSNATGGVSIVNKTEQLNLLSENITKLIGA